MKALDRLFLDIANQNYPGASMAAFQVGLASAFQHPEWAAAVYQGVNEVSDNIAGLLRERVDAWVTDHPMDAETEVPK